MAIQKQAWSQQISPLGTLIEHEPMARHTTLMVGGAARWFFRPDDRAAVISAVLNCPADVPILPLGRGSNMLIPDAGYNGLVIDLSGLNAIVIDGNAVTAEAGARMSRVARQCAEHGLTGCEFMATVPGDVGGGIAMNAGCFDQQVSDTLNHVEVVLGNGQVQQIQADDLNISYRHTSMPHRSLVLSASFVLRSDQSEQIRERMRSMRSRRSATQPLSQPNCGSVFKNPVGDHAARLIEAAGLKGFNIGGARISNQHANFMVNEGDACSADFVALIAHAQQAVKQQFGVELEPEVRLIGEGL
ncbi:MAG: UDP-N-acetylmuramate dehydrogenase [Mariprofundus sp.]|nr:UDP-N-acetylmuramate dehydrogenase [Mariprofundus sp.]